MRGSVRCRYGLPASALGRRRWRNAGLSGGAFKRGLGFLLTPKVKVHEQISAITETTSLMLTGSGVYFH
jgi:hypothetical protein